MFVDALVELSDSNAVLASLKYIKGQILFRAGLRKHHSGGTIRRADADNAASYITRVVDDYQTYGQLDTSDLCGNRILEIGPGDTLGVALLLVARGAESVTCLDRFKPVVDIEKNRYICERLLDGMSSEQRERVKDLLPYVSENASSPDGRITAKYGIAVEDFSEQSSFPTFDLVISRAVLEHVYDLDSAWKAMVKCLKPRGKMIHKVDFRNHKFFSKIHPLYFLTFSDWFWSLLSSPDPTLNRKRMNTYRSLLKETFSTHAMYITSILDNQELVPHPMEVSVGKGVTQSDIQTVHDIRTQLAFPFKCLDDTELLVSGVFIRCEDKLCEA